MQRKNEIEHYYANNKSHAENAGTVFELHTGYNPRNYNNLTHNFTLFFKPYSNLTDLKNGAPACFMHTIKLVRDVLSFTHGLELALYSICTKKDYSDPNAQFTTPYIPKSASGPDQEEYTAPPLVANSLEQDECKKNYTAAILDAELVSGLLYNGQAIGLDILNIIASVIMTIARVVATIIDCVQKSRTFSDIQEYLNEHFLQVKSEQEPARRTSSTPSANAVLVASGEEQLTEITYNYSR